MKFNSIESALTFAFSVRERQDYARLDLLGVRSTGGDRMTPLDLHAQGAMIISRVNTLPDVEMLTVYAQWAYGKERDLAVGSWAQIHAEGLGVSVSQARDSLSNWVKRSPSLRKIAADHGASYRQANTWRKKVLDTFLPMQRRALDSLHDQLIDRS
jgi:hypothetical protein